MESRGEWGTTEYSKAKQQAKRKDGPGMSDEEERERDKS